MGQRMAVVIQWPGVRNSLVSAVFLTAANEMSIRRDFLKNGALNNAVWIDHELTRRVINSVAETGIEMALYKGNLFGWPALLGSLLFGTVLVRVRVKFSMEKPVSLAEAKEEIAGAIELNPKAYTRASAEELASRVRRAGTWTGLIRRFAQD